jgi:proteic killer suppression protein
VAIRTFRHKGLAKLWDSDSAAGVNPQHAAKLKRQLVALDAAASLQDMNRPGWFLHDLRGDRAGEWAVSVSGNWRLTFRFEGTDAVGVNYEDYH